MRHVPVSCEQRAAMLRAVGCSGIDDLFEQIPHEVRLGRPLDLPEGLGEIELVRELRALAGENVPATGLVSFAGAGCYDHHIPAIVDHVVRKPEFFTAYTPYQPEVSQGTLQAIFEYQTMICELTGMEVANASVYDGATALVEAALMAARLTGRRRVLVSHAVHPEWRAVLATYARAGVIEVAPVAMVQGATDPEAARAALGDDVAALLLADPGFYGRIEDVRGLAAMAHDAGALLVVASNPMLLGVMTAPADLGADIVVGEGQPLGAAMSFGGPGFGFFACREEHLRQMPGRLVGRTRDADGATGYVLTFSTREQHIRRAKATSNICSNQALCALAAAVHLSALGPEGLAEVGHACVAKAHHLRERLLAGGRFSAPWDGAFGHEFALRFDGDVAAMREAMLDRGFLAGVDIGQVVAGAGAGGEAGVDTTGLVLFAVTEKRTAAEIEAFVEAVSAR